MEIIRLKINDITPYEKNAKIHTEAQTATGYRKKDLMRKYRKMQKELSECMMYLKKR